MSVVQERFALLKYSSRQSKWKLVNSVIPATDTVTIFSIELIIGGQRIRKKIHSSTTFFTTRTHMTYPKIIQLLLKSILGWMLTKLLIIGQSLQSWTSSEHWVVSPEFCSKFVDCFMAVMQSFGQDSPQMDSCIKLKATRNYSERAKRQMEASKQLKCLFAPE